jgi:hypothetical protein
LVLVATAGAIARSRPAVAVAAGGFAVVLDAGIAFNELFRSGAMTDAQSLQLRFLGFYSGFAGIVRAPWVLVKRCKFDVT